MRDEDCTCRCLRRNCATVWGHTPPVVSTVWQCAIADRQAHLTYPLVRRAHQVLEFGIPSRLIARLLL
jgi:hypothetical protein